MSTPPPGLPGDDPEERDPGLAHERTSLAWLRTALSFAALGGVVLKVNLLTGLLVLAVAPVVWQLGRVSRGDVPGSAAPGRRRPGRPCPRPARPGCSSSLSRWSRWRCSAW